MPAGWRGVSTMPGPETMRPQPRRPGHELADQAAGDRRGQQRVPAHDDPHRLQLGGVLTEYLSWRWCLYVNLLFAGLAVMRAVLLLGHQRARTRPRLDLPGAALVSASMFSLVYGFSNAANHNWHTPSTYGFLAAGVALLIVFACWQARAASPLLPPRVVLDRNRAGAYLAVLTVGAGMFGIFLFLTYYMQQTLGYSPVVTGVAFLPVIAMVVVAANLSNVVLLHRVGPKPLVTAGLLLAAGSLVWLTRIGLHSSYATAVLGPLMAAGLGFGLTMAPSMNTGTFGVAPQDAGVASATLNTGQQIGGSVGTSLLNTIFASAVAHYLTSHLSPATLVHGHPASALAGSGGSELRLQQFFGKRPASPFVPVECFWLVAVFDGVGHDLG
jgi:hypothetical protein